MPAPSQWPVPLQAVPLGAKFIPQLPATHVRVAQTESVPGQFDALTHCTQLPAPLQTPFGHGAPAGAGGLEHTPPVQTALMHGLQEIFFWSAVIMTASILLHIALRRVPLRARTASESQDASAAAAAAVH